MEQEKIVDIAIRAGSSLLQFGAETYRAEDTITRICKSYGLPCETFALTTGVFVSVAGQNGITTICKRIATRSVDLSKIAHINDLSRRIEKHSPTYEEVMQELDRILECKKYSNITIIICYALTAFAYSMLFGGNLNDAMSALVVGALISFIRLFFSKVSSFPFIEYFVSGFAVGILSSISRILLSNTNPYVIIIGAVTNMLPGVALTNGIRDLLHGDNVSGLSRLGEAFMVVAVIAVGTGIGLSLWLFGGRL